MQELKGTVTRAETFGIFVRLDDSNVTGLVHVSEISGKFVKNVPAEYPPGRKVKAVVLSIDAEKGRLALGMKAKYFTDEAPTDEAVGKEAEESVQASDIRGKSMDIDVETALLAAYDESDDGDGSDGMAEEDLSETSASDDEVVDVAEAGNHDEEEDSQGTSMDVDVVEKSQEDDTDDSQLQSHQASPKADPYGYRAAHFSAACDMQGTKLFVGMGTRHTATCNLCSGGMRCSSLPRSWWRKLWWRR